jgi:hypothetical protein
MYYPIQIPYILGKSFTDIIQYKEEVIPRFKDFVICFWEMQPFALQEPGVDSVILADGCIDLVVDFETNAIRFSGMSKTIFDDETNLPSLFYGARFKPGAFYNLTNIPASEVMDKSLPINELSKDFNVQSFFELPFD